VNVVLNTLVDLLLVASANHQEEEVERRTGSKVSKHLLECFLLRFQGKQTPVRCFLLLVASASHKEEEEGRRAGSKVNKQQLECFLLLIALTNHQQEEESGTSSKVIKQQIDVPCSWLPQPDTSRRRRGGEPVPR
jgi:hypothetical protein